VPGEQIVVAGTPSVGALGAVDLSGAVAEALALAMPHEARFAERLGRDRLGSVTLEMLGRRLFVSPDFLVHEASIDRGVLEPILLEVLYADVFAAREAAALGRFSVDVLSRVGDLPARLREYLHRAVSSAPAPAWAVH